MAARGLRRRRPREGLALLLRIVLVACEVIVGRRNKFLGAGVAVAGRAADAAGGWAVHAPLGAHWSSGLSKCGMDTRQ